MPKAKMPDAKSIIVLVWDYFQYDYPENLKQIMEKGFYESRIRPIMYNYIKETRYLQRNAAIAMGNLGEEKFIPDLELELENPDEMVREAVEWALEQIKKRSEK